MNKNILKISTLVAFWAFCSQNATAQQGFGTNQPSKASVIEMKSGTKGLLIPRVALTGLNNFDPIKGELGTDAAKVNSLLVYNTATTTGITPGYYYWTTDGTTPNSYWKRLLAGDDAAALNLLGDVTGTLGATTVVKIQGRDVANTAPTSNQVLTWNGTAWTPTSLTPAQITNKANLSVQDGIAITAGSGTDALLGAATIGITDRGIAPIKIQPAAEPRTTRMVMVTQTDGTVTWIPQTDIAPTTTNDLTSAANSMTSNVNGVSSSANIINSNTLVLTGDNLESTVNGVATTPAVDLSKYLDNTDKQEITDFSVTGGNLSITIENGNTMTVPLSSIDTDNQTITDLSLNGTQLSITLERGNTIAVELAALTNTTNLGNGTNTTVSGDGSSTTPYTVNVATGNGNTLGVVRQAETNPTVNVTNGDLAVNLANTILSGEVTGPLNNNIVANDVIDAANLKTDAVVTNKIANANVTPIKIQPAATFAQTQVMVTDTGGVVKWVDQSTISPATTVSNTSPDNTLITTVNGVPSTAVNLVKTVGLSLTGNNLTSTVNGVSNITPLDLSSIDTDKQNLSLNTTTHDLSIESGTGVNLASYFNSTKLENGTNTTVTGTGTVTDKYKVNVAPATTSAVGVVKPGTGLTVAIDGTLNAQASNGYSTTEYLTGKKWTDNALVYEAVFTVSITTNETNNIIVPGASKPKKILSMRMISQADNSVTTEISRYDFNTGTIVFGSGRTTQYQKVGTYDLILEYTK